MLGTATASSASSASHSLLVQREKSERTQSLKRKHEMLTELHSQQAAYRQLAARNVKAEQLVLVHDTARIQVPFLLVRTRAQCTINCEVDDSKTEYFLNFTMPFEIHDDHAVLTALGLAGGASVPTLEQYATQLLSETMAAQASAAAAGLATGPPVAPPAAVASPPPPLPPALAPLTAPPVVSTLPAAPPVMGSPVGAKK